MPYAETGEIVFVGMSIASGIAVGWYAKRALSFIVLIVALPIAVVSAIYLYDVYYMQHIGRGYGESWAGLVIPLVSIKSFAIAFPMALVVAGIKWGLTRKSKLS